MVISFRAKIGDDAGEVERIVNQGSVFTNELPEIFTDDPDTPE